MPQQREAHPENVLRIVATQFFSARENKKYKIAELYLMQKNIELCRKNRIPQNGKNCKRFPNFPRRMFFLRSEELSPNLRTKRVCLDKSIDRRPLPFSVESSIERNRKKRNARFYSRWGGTTEHIQLNICISGMNVNFVPRPLQGKLKPPYIDRFHLLCRAAFFHI